MIFLVLTLPVCFAVSINPDSITVEVTETTATIDWETDTNAISYIDYGETIGDLTQVPSTQGNNTNHSVLLYGLDPGEKYYYELSATDNGGTYTTSTYDFTTMLSAPNNLEASEISYDYVTLIWDEVDNARKYNVYRDNTLLDDPTENEYTDNNVSSTSTYEYKVAAVNDADELGEFSDILEVTTIENPINITFIQVTDITKNTAELSFKLSREYNATVYYGQTEDYNMSIPIAEEETEHEIIFKNLEEDTTYFFEIEAGIATSDRYDFTTMSNDTQILITDIEVKDITRESVEIHWTTNVETEGEVFYGLDDSLSSSVAHADEEIYHIIELEELLGGTTYYYKIVADNQETEIMEFSTSEYLSDFLDLEPTADLVSDKTLVIKGTTKENAILYAWVNRDSSPIAQYMNSSVTNGIFEFKLELSPYSYIDDTVGKNIVEINSWDEDGAKAVKEFEVLVDTLPPSLQVYNIPLYTNKDKINVTGYTDTDATIEVILDETSQGMFTPQDTETGYFETIVKIGSATKGHNITIIASDKAGNEVSETLEINVDTNVPHLDFYTAFSGETHYKVFRIDGYTEPGAYITVRNFGPYQGCGDISFTDKFGTCKQIADVYGAGPDQEIAFGGDVPHSLMFAYDVVLGQPTGVYADEGGNFSVLVAMYSDPEKIGMVGKNYMEFNVTDLAGNAHIQTKSISYRPACPEWILGKINSFPLNIYTEDMKSGNIDGSAIIELDFLGASTPEKVIIRNYEDDSPGTLITDQGSLTVGTGTPLALTHSLGGLSNSNEYISLGDMKQTDFDHTNRKVYVYMPVVFNKYTGSPDKLPDNMGVYLDLRIEYTDYLGRGVVCDLYPVLSFPVQKPETLLKWLSPTMLNATVQFLDKSIDVTQAAVDFFTQASRWTLIGCGATIAYNYAKGFFGAGTSTEPVCMKEVYWVCDRVLCPPIPPKCDSLKPVDQYDFGKPIGATGDEEEISAADGGASKYADQLEINQEYEEKFYGDWQTHASEHGNEDITFEQYLSSQYKDPARDEFTTDFDTLKDEHGAYRSANRPERYRAEHNGQEITVSYFDIDEKLQNGKTAAQEFGYTSCPTGKNTKSFIVIQGLEQEEAGFLTVGEAQLDRTIRCSTDDVETLLEEHPPEDEGFPGCFSPECPNFDKSKCLIGQGAGLNPTDGLLVSLQCMCLPAAKAHLSNILKLMMSAKLCFESALLGETTAGACERLLSYFVCDILTELFKFFFKNLTGASGYGGTGASAGYQSFRQHSAQVTQDVSQRYGPIMGQLGLSTDQLVNNACIGAFTGDWSMLEGALDKIVDSVEVRPMYTADATSRPYGYDPFTGRISIGYNIYFGLIPGGETYVTITFECDRTMEGADYCKRGQVPLDLSRETSLPGTLSKSQDFNENVFYIDSNAESWYNKMIVEVKYKSGQVYETEIKEYPIRKKGDLSLLGCRLSTTAGISCQIAPEFLDMTGGGIGSVLLYSDSQGSTLSPNIQGYYGTNQIAALVKLKNGYGKDFFLNVDDNAINRQFRLTGGIDETRLKDDRWYLVWLGDVMGTAGTGGYGYLLPWKTEEEHSSIIFTHATDEEFGIELNADLQMMDMNLQLAEEVSGSLEIREDLLCEIERDPSGTPAYLNQYGVWITTTTGQRQFRTITDSNWKDVCDEVYSGTVDCSATDWATLSIADKEPFDRIITESGITYYMCIKPIDGVSADQITKIDFVNHRKMDDTKDILKYSFNLRGVNVYTTSNPSGKELTITYSGSSSLTAGSQKTKINVLEDVNGNGCGETMIYSGDARDPQMQEFDLFYSIVQKEAPGNSEPAVHFIEPITIIDDTTGYVNNDGNPVPIGFTIWDDRDQIKEIQIGIFKQDDRAECEKVFTYDETEEDLNIAIQEQTTGTSSNCVLKLNKERSIGLQSGKPPFFEFDLYPNEGIITTGEDDLYEITIRAKDEGTADATTAELFSDPTAAKRVVRFEPQGIEDMYTREDLMVCLGAGHCSGGYGEATVCSDIIQGPGLDTAVASSPNYDGDLYGPYPEFDDMI
jgi:hypothetical protein